MKTNTRLGMGKGRGIGYYNIAPLDSHVHSMSAKGIKSKSCLLNPKNIKLNAYARSGMRTFPLDNEYSVIAYSERTRQGFRHVAILMHKGYEVEKATANYLNRTWEEYTYQSVFHKLFDKLKDYKQGKVFRDALDRRYGYSLNRREDEEKKKKTIAGTPKIKETMTNEEAEKRYQYELDEGLINTDDTPHYNSLNEFKQNLKDMGVKILDAKGTKPTDDQLRVMARLHPQFHEMVGQNLNSGMTEKQAVKAVEDLIIKKVRKAEKEGKLDAKGNKQIYVGELGEAIISKKGKITAHYVEEFDGTKSWQLNPDETRGDKVLKSVKVEPIEKLDAKAYKHRNSKEAFEDAIKSGRLSKDPKAKNYAGKFMYMGTFDGKDEFKDILNRTYLNAKGKDIDKTPVIFRKIKSGQFKGDILAIMPENVDSLEQGQVTMYEHVGQHSSGDYQTAMMQTKPAKPREYAKLKKELTEIGYRVKPVMKDTPKFQQTRRKLLQNYWGVR